MTYGYPTAFSAWGEEERAAIARVIESGRFTIGAEVEAFEEEFAAWHGMKHGIMVNSGSSANLIAVAALFHKKDNPLRRMRWEGPKTENGRGVVTKPGEVGMRQGHVALVPAIAWSTTYAPLVQHGLRLELLDVDSTWNAPVAWYPRGMVGLIVVASILGNPAYADEWADEAEKLGAYMIEDNCESLGAMRNGEQCGTTGIMNTFSFYYSHQISAIEGGMILTNNDECARLCRMLRAHGWTRDVKKPETFADEYDFELMGYNVRPLEMHAAIAREQLKKLDRLNLERVNNYVHFETMTEDLPISRPDLNGRIVPFGLHFEVANTQRRADLVQAFRAEGIDCRLPTGGSFRRHVYGAECADQATPVADRIHERGLFIGNAPWPIAEKIDRAVAVMRKVLL